VHVHKSRLGLLVSVTLLVSGGCRSRPKPQIAPVIRSAALGEDGHVAPNPSIGTDDFCRGRRRCRTAKRQPIAGADDATLVEVRIAHSPDATSDEDRCDRREYWLARASGDALLAADCEVQWGADNPGPAQIKVEGTRLAVRYVEFQANDRCEIYEATVELRAGPRVETERRSVGTIAKDDCVPGSEHGALVPLGDGSADHPLLTLHR
jgi:hypothetical protein